MIVCCSVVVTGAGSQHYAAPEVAHSLTSDDRADVWSVGCICLHMVLAGLRGVDNINSLLDNIKYTPSLVAELTSLADEVMLSCLIPAFHCINEAMWHSAVVVRPVAVSLTMTRFSCFYSAHCCDQQTHMQTTIHK